MLTGITNINTKSWKEFLNLIKKSILKVKFMLPLVMINFGLIILVCYGIYRNSLDEQFYNNVIILGIIGIVLLVLTRIFLIAGVKEITK